MFICNSAHINLTVYVYLQDGICIFMHTTQYIYIFIYNAQAEYILQILFCMYAYKTSISCIISVNQPLISLLHFQLDSAVR